MSDHSRVSECEDAERTITQLREKVSAMEARVGELEKGLGKMLYFFETGLEDDDALKSSHPDWILLARGLFYLSRRLLSSTGETTERKENKL